jgi:hypothetical protein
MTIWREHAREIVSERDEEDVKANVEGMKLRVDEVSRLNEEEIEAKLMTEQNEYEDSNDGEERCENEEENEIEFLGGNMPRDDGERKETGTRDAENE